MIEDGTSKMRFRGKTRAGGGRPASKRSAKDGSGEGTVPRKEKENAFQTACRCGGKGHEVTQQARPAAPRVPPPGEP